MEWSARRVGRVYTNGVTPWRRPYRDNNGSVGGIANK